MLNRTDVEALGWQIVAEQAPYSEDLGDGLVRFLPGYFRAERSFNDTLINASGEDMETLLRAIDGFESHPRGARPVAVEDTPPDPEPEGLAA